MNRSAHNLLALNLEVASKIQKGDPITAPDIPKTCPAPKKLVTEDCIQAPTVSSKGD